MPTGSRERGAVLSGTKQSVLNALQKMISKMQVYKPLSAAKLLELSSLSLSSSDPTSATSSSSSSSSATSTSTSFSAAAIAINSESDDGFTTTVRWLVSQDNCGTLIGKGGSRIKQINEQCGGKSETLSLSLTTLYNQYKYLPLYLYFQNILNLIMSILYCTILHMKNSMGESGTLGRKFVICCS